MRSGMQLKGKTTFMSFFVSYIIICLDNKLFSGKINENLPSKIRDANKRDEHSSKLIPKSTHTAQDAILK